MTEQSLKDKTAKGLFWGGLSNGMQQLLNLIFGIALARILDAEDYGMIGMLSIFSLIASTLQESGFTAALANKKNISHEDYNAVFWFSLFTSGLLYILLFFLSPYIAEFYHTPALIPLARYTFLGFFIASLGIAHNAYLFRNLKVKQKAFIQLTGLILSNITGVTLALCGMAYWGIATQGLVYVTSNTILFWRYSGWKPTLHISFKPLKSMINFSCKILITNIFSNINNNMLTVILGRFYSQEEVGYFNQANKWTSMGYSTILGTINGIAQPVLRNVSEDTERQCRVFRKMLRFTAFISFSALFGLSLIAPELITITITDKWNESAIIMQILCIGSAFLPIQNLYSNLVISKGKSDIFMWNTIFLGIIQIATALLCYPYGIRTMIFAYISINISWLFVWHYFIWKEIHLTLWDALKDVVPFGVIAVSCMGAAYFLTRSIDNLYLILTAKIAIAAGLYIIIMQLSKSATFKEVINYLSKKK